MISVGGVLQAVLWVIVAGLVWWLLDWLVGYCGVPDPFARVARVVLAVLAVVLLISVILSLAGGPPVLRP